MYAFLPFLNLQRECGNWAHLGTQRHFVLPRNLNCLWGFLDKGRASSFLSLVVSLPGPSRVLGQGLRPARLPPRLPTLNGPGLGGTPKSSLDLCIPGDGSRLAAAAAALRTSEDSRVSTKISLPSREMHQVQELKDFFLRSRIGGIVPNFCNPKLRVLC